jgi:tetratricopeptide (TPR) repeat protein
MMFNKIDSLTNSTEENTQFIPVSSLEEVAMHLRDSDEDSNYEYYLVRITHPKKKILTPPPFTGKPSSPKPHMNSAMVSSEVVEPAAERRKVQVDSFVDESEEKLARNIPAQETAQAQAPSQSARKATAEVEDISFLVQNAELLLQVGEIELARNIFRAVLKSGESSDVAYAGLAACSDKEGLIEQAIQFAWDSVAFAPNKKGYQILSQLLVQQGRDQEAAQSLNRAIKSLELSAQEKAEYYKMIGNCMARLGQNPEAERAFKKALELSPASDETQANLGSLYLEQGQVADAKRCYQDAIASNPANDKAWVGLGLCFVSEGDKEAAHDAFSRSLERNLRNSTAIFHLVKCAYEIKKYSQAERMLSSYVDVAPVSPSLLYSLAGLQFHVGKKKEASQTAKRILQIKGDHQGARDLVKRIEAE